MVLAAKQVICHANSTMGLVESGVGVIPGGGGCKELMEGWAAWKKWWAAADAWDRVEGVMDSSCMIGRGSVIGWVREFVGLRLDPDFATLV